MEVLKNFSERLAELMKDEEINAASLGKEIGVGHSTVNRWLRIERKINLTNLIKLANRFNCTMDFLAGRNYDDMKFIPQNPPPFPQALRRALKTAGKSRNYLDKHTKFKDSYIYNWDHGTVPDIISLVELADILECTIDYLVGREN